MSEYLPMPRNAFLLQKPSSHHNMESIEEFGRPVSLFNRGFYPDDTKDRYGVIMAVCDKKLKRFDPNLDYIVPMGDSCVVAAVTIWLADNEKLPALYLNYDKKLGGFYPIKIGELGYGPGETVGV